MGLFSWECNYCHKSILGYMEIRGSHWSTAVVVYPNGSFFEGTYDGYGRLCDEDGGNRIYLPEEPCLYHQRCWREAGKPITYHHSKRAEDQGHFYDVVDYPYDDNSKRQGSRDQNLEAFAAWDMFLTGLVRLLAFRLVDHVPDWIEKEYNDPDEEIDRVVMALLKEKENG